METLNTLIQIYHLKQTVIRVFKNCKCEFWFGFDDTTNKLIPYKIIANANEITHIGKNQIFKLTNSKLSLIFNHKSNLEILGTVHLKGNKNATNFKISFSIKLKILMRQVFH